MKKVILGVLALLCSMALVIGGYLLITSRNLQTYAVEEGVPCPYFWQELRNGTYRLEIDTAAYPDGNWSVECYPKNVVAATEVSSDSGHSAFAILPLNMGQTYVQVYCEQTDPLAVRVFEVNMQVSVSEDLEITIESTEDKSYDGVATMGEDSDYPIQWWTAPDGVVNLLIEEESNGIWEVVDYAAEIMDVVGPFYRQGSCGFEIQGKAAGTFPLTVYDGVDKAIRMEIRVEEDMAAFIIDVAVESYTAAVDEAGEEQIQPEEEAEDAAEPVTQTPEEDTHG